LVFNLELDGAVFSLFASPAEDLEVKLVTQARKMQVLDLVRWIDLIDRIAFGDSQVLLLTGGKILNFGLQCEGDVRQSLRHLEVDLRLAVFVQLHIAELLRRADTIQIDAR